VAAAFQVVHLTQLVRLVGGQEAQAYLVAVEKVDPLLFKVKLAALMVAAVVVVEMVIVELAQLAQTVLLFLNGDEHESIDFNY
jgi:hypothetical protein